MMITPSRCVPAGLRVLLLAALAVLALVLRAAPAHAAACGLPDGTLWVDFSDGSVQFRDQVFREPGLVLAASGSAGPLDLRNGGAQTIHWENNLTLSVGTPTAPADPASIQTAVKALLQKAITSSGGCTTPYMGLNEMLDPSASYPLGPAEATYRANVIALLKGLTAAGARPFLLVPQNPNVTGAAADFWRQVGQTADIVQESYFNNNQLSKQGPFLASRSLRLAFRQRMQTFLDLGVPASRLGIMVGFQSAPGTGGREGLQPTAAWLEMVKLNALAVRQVSIDDALGSVWSWGWGTYSQAGTDPDKPLAACTYLWTRNNALCPSAPTIPGFDTDVTTGQLSQLPPGVQCTFDGGAITTGDVQALEPVTGDEATAVTMLVERALMSAAVNVTTADVRRAEQGMIEERFAGSRTRFLTALAARHANEPLALQAIGDLLRRRALSSTLPISAPSLGQVSTFVRSHGYLLTRKVKVLQAAPWLGGAHKGVAVATMAPARIFTARLGSTINVRSTAGRYRVRIVGVKMNLRQRLASDVRGAVSSSLLSGLRDAAFPTWLANHETTALTTALCQRDVLPTAGDESLTQFLPFLRLDP
jgi:hypothetical protein